MQRQCEQNRKRQETCHAKSTATSSNPGLEITSNPSSVLAGRIISTDNCELPGEDENEVSQEMPRAIEAIQQPVDGTRITS